MPQSSQPVLQKTCDTLATGMMQIQATNCYIFMSWWKQKEELKPLIFCPLILSKLFTKWYLCISTTPSELYFSHLRYKHNLRDMWDIYQNDQFASVFCDLLQFYATSLVSLCYHHVHHSGNCTSNLSQPEINHNVLAHCVVYLGQIKPPRYYA